MRFRIFLINLIGLVGLLFFSVVSMMKNNVFRLDDVSVDELSLRAPVVLATESLFGSKIVEKTETIPFDTKVETDVEKDACGEPQVIQAGVKGSKTIKYKVIYYNGEEYDRQVVDVAVVKPVDEIKIKGLKKIYKSMQTDSGTITYWCKLGDFTATAYDPTCIGCSMTTAIGMKPGFGVVAVDKRIIPLGSRLYITGYGRAIAGDTGGAIKGRRIDLGFDSIGSWWGRRTVEVYML